MQGVWEAKGSEKQIISLIVQDDSVILFLETGEQGVKTKLELDSSKEPKRFDLVFPDNGGKFERWQGIYELSDKLIKAAFSDPRPTSFTEKNTWLFEWKGKSSNFTPVDPDYIKGVATWNYWMRLHNIHNRNNPGGMFTKAQEPEQAIATARKGIEALKSMRSDINRISVANVDTEATSYAAEYLDTLNLLESMLGEIISIIEDAQELAEVRESDEALDSVMLDLFFGRPNATIDALDAEAQELKRRMLEVQRTARRGSEESDKLGTKQLKLRSSLASKYRREFPQFTL